MADTSSPKDNGQTGGEPTSTHRPIRENLKKILRRSPRDGIDEGAVGPTKTLRGRLLLTFTVGIAVRFILAAYTQHVATWDRITALDALFIGGLNPTYFVPEYGTTFYLLYIPMYAIYLAFSSIGIKYNFILLILFRIPPIIGDIAIFYALYEIALHFSNNSKTSGLLATLYFLNPFTIWESSILGHDEQIIAAFLLLSILFVIRQSFALSGIFYALATFRGFLPILFLPVFFMLVRGRSNSNQSGALANFAATFFASTLLLLLPLIISFLQLYNASSTAFWSYFNSNWIDASGTGGQFLPIYYKHNFTGFLATLGVWPLVSSLFGARSFILVYSVVTILTVRLHSISIRSVNDYIITIFALFMVILPLLQPHYLLWILPFLLLASSIFHDLPMYLTQFLWLVTMLIEPVIEGNFLQYPNWTVIQYNWLLNNWPFKESLSLLSGISLLLIIGYSFVSSRKKMTLESQPGLTLPLDFTPGVSDVRIILLTYASVFSILRLVYLSGVGTYESLLLFLEIFAWGCALLTFVRLPERTQTGLSLLSVPSLKWSSFLSLGVLLGLTIAISPSRLDSSVFILAQCLYLGILIWREVSSSNFITFARISALSTTVYVGYLVLTSVTLLTEILLLIYIAAWLVMEIASREIVIPINIRPEVGTEKKLAVDAS